MAQVRDLRGSRRDLAIVFGDGWKTAHEAAEAVGRPTGSIFGVLRRMHAEGLLISDADPDPPTRGTQYRLSDDTSEALSEALLEESGVGQLIEGQRLLVVERKKSRLAAIEVLTESVSAGLIVWGAELPSGWLLAMDLDADSFRVQTLAVAFERAGCRCYEAPVDAIVPGSLLRKRATTVSRRSS
jgi:hypothetical protein